MTAQTDPDPAGDPMTTVPLVDLRDQAITSLPGGDKRSDDYGITVDNINSDNEWPAGKDVLVGLVVDR